MMQQCQISYLFAYRFILTAFITKDTLTIFIYREHTTIIYKKSNADYSQYLYFIFEYYMYLQRRQTYQISGHSQNTPDVVHVFLL